MISTNFNLVKCAGFAPPESRLINGTVSVPIYERTINHSKDGCEAIAATDTITHLYGCILFRRAEDIWYNYEYTVLM